MLEKHGARSKYSLGVINNGEIRNNNNVFKTELKGMQNGKNCANQFTKKTFRNALPQVINLLWSLRLAISENFNNLKNIMFQILATCAKNLLLLTYGMTLGITTIAIPALEKNSYANASESVRRLRSDSLTLTDGEISWFSKF